MASPSILFSKVFPMYTVNKRPNFDNVLDFLRRLLCSVTRYVVSHELQACRIMNDDMAQAIEASPQRPTVNS